MSSIGIPDDSPGESPERIDLGLIYGSVRAGRACDTVAEWTAEMIQAHGGYRLDTLDPAEPAVAAAVEGRDAGAAAALRRRLDATEAFVVVTPEYNHSYPAALKALIDSAKAEWQAKPVAFVSYGGLSGGIRAVEHLRHVFAELHAVGLRDGVSFANIGRAFDAGGRPHDAEGAEGAARVMLGRLAWWANALTAARSARAYELAA